MLRLGYLPSYQLERLTERYYEYRQSTEYSATIEYYINSISIVSDVIRKINIKLDDFWTRYVKYRSPFLLSNYILRVKHCQNITIITVRFNRAYAEILFVGQAFSLLVTLVHRQGDDSTPKNAMRRIARREPTT
jgi:hypothetical protein